jgi:parvulin-like peptidyl-prolyl isomerase
LARKQKRATPKPVPTKRQLSKWQRQMKIRRIVMIAAVVFLAGLVSWVSFSYYKDRVAPYRETVITVNDASFNMGYYVDMLDFRSSALGEDTSWIYYMADMVATSIIDAAVLTQGAKSLGIEVAPAEIDARLEELGWPPKYDWPDERVLRDTIGVELLWDKLEIHFDSQLPNTMEQVRAEVMLVESKEVAEQVIAAVEGGGNFTILVDQLSRHPSIRGDLGWLPEELMPNDLIRDAAFNVTPGEVSEPIHDQLATKSIGYWLIEVLDSADDEDVTEVKARAILLGSEAEAVRLRTELIGGNFTALAMQYSQHESKADGGELGWLKPGDMDSQAFDEVAFTIAPNQVSQPVRDTSMQTTGGYWIVHVIDAGEAELTAGSREQLAERDLVAAFDEWKEDSTIANRLDVERQSWAITQVIRRR